MHYWMLLFVGTSLYALLDTLWVKLLRMNLFKSKITTLLRDKTNQLASLFVWLLISSWILIFVVSSAAVSDAGDAFSLWVVFWLVVYGIYESTNQALLKSRNRNLVLAGTAWGMLLCGFVSMLLRYLATALWVI